MGKLIGQDAGCAYIKTVIEDENGHWQEYSVPSLARSGSVNVGMGGVSGVTYECQDEEWSINTNMVDSEDTRFNDYPFSPLNRVLSIHALLEAGLAGQDLEIASGLPLNQFFTEKSGPDNVMIKRKHESFKAAVRKLGAKGFETVDISVVSKKVCPEALAGW